MGRTVSELSPEETEAYRQAWRSRRAAIEAALRKRADVSLTVARQASSILKQEFGAQRVWLFGSLARGTFDWTSDVDLAVEGLPEREFFRAAGRLLGIHPNLPVDLVDVSEARPSVRRSIEAEGVLL